MTISPFKILPGLLLIGLLFLNSCEIPPQGQRGKGTQQLPKLPEGADQIIQQLSKGIDEAAIEFQELSHPNRVQAWVDQLIVKAQPGKDMPEIARMREGEMAEYLYQRTLRKSTYNLRGQRFHEPWILIRTQSGLMGWVHEGGVKYVSDDLLKWLQQGSQPNSNMRTRGATAPAAVIPAEDRMVIPGKRVGPIVVSTTEADLVRIYGPNEVGRGAIKAPGKGDQPCSVVFPGKKEEIRITWKDDSRERITAVYMMNAGGHWTTPQGLQVGIPMAELVKVNKAPVSFYGFGWNYAGTVQSWGKGALAPYAKGFYVMLSPIGASEAIQKSFKGDKVFSSNTAKVEEMNLYVTNWVVYLD